MEDKLSLEAPGAATPGENFELHLPPPRRRRPYD
jgi:hypothetical protein